MRITGFLSVLAGLALAATAAPISAQAQIVGGGVEDDAIGQSDIDQALADPQSGAADDPWEGFNRKMFAVNMFLDELILIPTAKLYRATTPKVGRRGVRRFLGNLRAPGIFVNDLLQGEFSRAGDTLTRFVVNTTIGAGGFADPAAQLGVASHNEDFGQTLAVWGVKSGPYLFLPLIGPSSPRDSAGGIAQIGLKPLTYIRTDAASLARYSTAGVGGVSAREQFLDPLEQIQSKSLDYYASFRSFYLQARKREINNGRTDYSDLPDIGEFEEFDEIQ